MFEDRELKAHVTREAEAELAATAIFASNTSTLPITGLAGASARAADFIGLHFFSPADRMPAGGIICGKDTSPETLARSYDFVQQIGKTPVIVNDARGFFTSRLRRNAVDAVTRSWAFLAAGTGEGVPAVVQQGVDQRAVRMARRRMHHHAHGLIHHDDVLILVDHVQRDILRDGLRLSSASGSVTHSSSPPAMR